MDPIQINGGDCAPVSIVRICKLGKKITGQNSNNDTEWYDMIVARDDGLVEIYAF